MKSIAILSFLLALTLPVAAPAGDFQRIGNGPLGPMVAAPDAQVFTNILGLAYGTPTIGYEQMLGVENSVTGQIGFRNWGGPGYSLSTLGLLGSYRWWIGEHARLQGFYAGPLVTVNLVTASYDLSGPSGGFLRRESASGYGVGVGAEGGYQWILPMHLTLGLGLNAGFSFGGLSLAPGAPSFSAYGLGTGLSGTIGYAF
jgi:hypothetical protein